MNVYKSLLISFLSLCFVQSCETQKGADVPARQPNILFLIADDWSYPHASIYGDQTVKTPTFDSLAKAGLLFTNAYCAAPSCTPSRAAILTGRYPHQLEGGGTLWSVLPKKFPNWMSILAENGYHTGHTRKGWAPGDYKSGGYEHNPAGPKFEDFTSFIAQKTENQPFAFWFGSTDPHRKYETNSGIKSGLDPATVRVPGFMPDVPCVRNDMLDYYFEVARFDRECGEILQQLMERGELENTLIVMTSDNGMPFPRAKATLYSYGTRMPLVIAWGDKIKEAREVAAFTNSIDFGPTILAAAGLEVPTAMSGKSLFDIFENKTSPERNHVFLEKERHANVRAGDLSYPQRGIRTEQYLYIRNFEPDRWPAGDPTVHQSVGQYGDIDNSISKFLIMDRAGTSEPIDYFQLAMAKRPPEELYDVVNDPFQLRNLAAEASMQGVKEGLQTQLANWMRESEDIRSTDPNTIYYDTVLYTPDYQFENYNLAAEIAQYKYLNSEGQLVSCE